MSSIAAAACGLTTFTVEGLLRASADDGEYFMVDLVARHAGLEVIAGWLAEHCSAAEGPDLPEVSTR